ncbi:MAG: hypothetical protein ACOYEV_03590 [Candidatus Nanopelagicales bacterium]
MTPTVTPTPTPTPTTPPIIVAPGPNTGTGIVVGIDGMVPGSPVTFWWQVAGVWKSITVIADANGRASAVLPVTAAGTYLVRATGTALVNGVQTPIDKTTTVVVAKKVPAYVVKVKGKKITVTIKAKCKFPVTIQKRKVAWGPGGSDDPNVIVTWHKYGKKGYAKKGKTSVFTKKVTTAGTYRAVIGAGCGYGEVITEPFTVGKVRSTGKFIPVI